jgi:hypothetical protein
MKIKNRKPRKNQQNRITVKELKKRLNLTMKNIKYIAAYIILIKIII